MIHSFSSTATAAAAAATVVETIGESDISSLSPQGRKMQYYRYNNSRHQHRSSYSSLHC